MTSALKLFFDFIGWPREGLVEGTSSPYSDGVNVPPGRPAAGVASQALVDTLMIGVTIILFMVAPSHYSDHERRQRSLQSCLGVLRFGAVSA